MTTLMTVYHHSLRIRLDSDAPKEYVKKWNKFKSICEGGNPKNNIIVNKILKYCELDQNKKLSILDRLEGGLGGNDNLLHKQIRFRHCIGNVTLDGKIRNSNDNDIVLDQVISTPSEKWTYEELDDILHALIQTANHCLDEECVMGCIELENKQFM